MRRRHARIAFAQAADHPAAGDDCIHHIPERLRLFAALLVGQRLFAARQQHVADRQRAVDAQPHRQWQVLRLRCQYHRFVPLRQRIADARQQILRRSVKDDLRLHQHQEVGVVEDLKMQRLTGIVIPDGERGPRRTGGGNGGDAHKRYP